VLFAPGLSSFRWTYDNWGANPTATHGTAVTPGASNVEGSWTQVASAANIANHVYWVELRITDGNTTGQAKNHLLDLGIDSAGGTSYTACVSNIIAAGSSVAVRIQGSHATAGTVRVSAKFYGQPSHLEAMPTSSVSETVGAITNSNGVSFTPGNAADGTWASLGTTVLPLWWWQLGVQIDNTTITALLTYVDLAFGDATNKHIINRVMLNLTTVETIGHAFPGNLNLFNCYCPVPAGATMYVRGRCSGAPVTGYNAVAVGFG
jgi:hypothetical protein